IFSPWLKGNIQVAATLDFLLGARVFREKDGDAAMLDRWQPALLAWQQGLPEQGFSGLTGGLGVGGSVR
ncbi:MAG: hypothetical protein VX498_06165, partial [Myxococcota bacterium]|nr:hypothetical protein [Myxococcota bacterium]